jgi:hypothetical protein
MERKLPPLEKPSSDLSPDKEAYCQEMVEEYLDNPKTFSEKYDFPTHHYNQASKEWGDQETVQELINRFDIDPEGNTATVFGGFTGEFAKALQQCGFEVIFTDPLSDWVEEASNEGMEAHTELAETLPPEIVNRTAVFATFECYHPFGGDPDAIYNMLRFLSAPLGLLFAESESTRNFFKEEGVQYTLLTDLGKFSEFYEVERRYRETDGLRIYQFCSPKWEHRILIQQHAQIIGQLYANAVESDEEQYEFSGSELQSIADQLGMDRWMVETAVESFSVMAHDRMGELGKYIPNNQFELGSVQFSWVDYNA